MFDNFKRFVRSEDIALVLIIIVVGISSFMLGRLSVTSESLSSEVASTIGQNNRDESVPLGAVASSSEMEEEAGGLAGTGGYVASKNGTKYHLPWCSGAQRIKEENKVWFKTKEEAESAGYSPATNCKGI